MPREDSNIEIVDKNIPTVEERFDDDALQQENSNVESDVIVDESSAKRQAIYDKAAKRNADESTPVTDDSDEPAVTPEPSKDEDDLDPDDELDNDPVDEPEAEKQVKVKIYGQERLVDKKVVDAAGGIKEYQKQVAAAEKAQVERDRAYIEQESKRLADEKRELERLRQQQTVPSQDPSKTSDLPSDDQAAEKEKNRAELLKSAGEHLLDGDVGEYTRLMNQYYAEAPTAQRSEAEPVDIDKIVEQVEQRTIQNMSRQQQQAAYRDARETFFVEHPDLAADADLFAKVDRRTVILQEEHPDKSPTDIVRLAAEEVRKAYVPDRQPPSNPAQSRQAKVAAKRAMSKPSGGSTVSQPPPEPEQPTASDYVAQLRQQRGQG